MKPEVRRQARASLRKGGGNNATVSDLSSMTAESPSPVGIAEDARRKQIETLNRVRRSSLGQFFTPPETARLMASMFSLSQQRLRILDAGAGAGALTAALVEAICARNERPKEIFLVAYELDEGVLPDLRRTLVACENHCAEANICFTGEIRATDFIESAVTFLDTGLFQTDHQCFDIAILNPPYKKFRAESRIRKLLRRLNIETSNLYAAFLALVVLLLDKDGELVAITPRSFCNGPYFRPFREHLLRNVNLTQLHVFESRFDAFKEDKILQENLILHAVKSVPQQKSVGVSKSQSPYDPVVDKRCVPFDSVVRPGDPEVFIHLVPDGDGHVLARSMEMLPCTLDALGLNVSTGRVVDFRARKWLRANSNSKTVPLIYPAHFDNGLVQWPKLNFKKANAIEYNAASASLMVPSGIYVLARRFSAKEERRRVVAAIFDPETVPCEVVGFENHVNYFHERGAPLDRNLAYGLSVFLNSTPLDSYFRQFNGHTQVNATDLRSLRYPTRDSLVKLGQRVGQILPAQSVIDFIVGETIGVP